MTQRELTYEDLVKIVELVRSTSQFSEFRLKVGEIEVSLKRADGAPRAIAARPAAAPEPAAEAAKVPVREVRSFSGHVVTAPMVGTFYRAPAPGEAPFVEVGQKVEPDTMVCIIEVMKLMNSIEAGVRGVVREIVASNAANVEYGEPLIVIEPAP